MHQLIGILPSSFGDTTSRSAQGFFDSGRCETDRSHSDVVWYSANRQFGVHPVNGIVLFMNETLASIGVEWRDLPSLSSTIIYNRGSSQAELGILIPSVRKNRSNIPLTAVNPNNPTRRQPVPSGSCP